MSKVDRKYFKWDPKSTRLDINLGDTKEFLLREKLIEEIESEGEIDYSGRNGIPWRVSFKDESVSSIWFKRNNSFKINGTEILREIYAEIEPILESNLQSLNSEIKNIEEYKSYTDSNVLHIICRDFFVDMIAIVKKYPKIT